MTKKDLREELAALCHDQESHSMSNFIITHFPMGEDGSITIPSEEVQQRLLSIGTPYDELSETEKELDRLLADKILSVINKKF